MRSTGGPGLLTCVSWGLKRGLWLTMTLASPTETSEKLEVGHGVGNMKEGGCLGEAVAQPEAERLPWKSIFLGRLGSDRTLI